MDVVVTGVGASTPLGDVSRTFDRILAGESAAREHDDLAQLGLPIARACRVDLETPPNARGATLARIAAGAAISDAALEPDRCRSTATWTFVGTTMGESAAYEQHPGPGAPEGAAADSFARDLADVFGLQGSSRTFGTACAAGNYAIGAAADAIRRGRCDVALAGGVEPFSMIAFVGFARMRAMTPDRCRPFGADRRGMQLGEGAAFVVLESAENASRRGVRPLARIGALGLTCDAHHPTRPRDDGSGMAGAMCQSIRRSGLSPDDVVWVNAHGTGTQASDEAEARAVGNVFEGRRLPLTSLKAALGHSLGAASAIEAALTVESFVRALVPPTVGVGDIDAALDVDVVVEPRPAAPGWVLNCGYAFGGLNSALCLGPA